MSNWAWGIWLTVSLGIAGKGWKDWRTSDPDDRADRWALTMTTWLFVAIISLAAAIIWALTGPPF